MERGSQNEITSPYAGGVGIHRELGTTRDMSCHAANVHPQVCAVKVVPRHKTQGPKVGERCCVIERITLLELHLRTLPGPAEGGEQESKYESETRALIKVAPTSEW